MLRKDEQERLEQMKVKTINPAEIRKQILEKLKSQKTPQIPSTTKSTMESKSMETNGKEHLQHQDQTTTLPSACQNCDSNCMEFEKGKGGGKCGGCGCDFIHHLMPHQEYDEQEDQFFPTEFDENENNNETNFDSKSEQFQEDDEYDDEYDEEGQYDDLPED